LQVTNFSALPVDLAAPMFDFSAHGGELHRPPPETNTEQKVNRKASRWKWWTARGTCRLNVGTNAAG
jgi:hypothetical protein